MQMVENTHKAKYLQLHLMIKSSGGAANNSVLKKSEKVIRLEQKMVSVIGHMKHSLRPHK